MHPHEQPSLQTDRLLLRPYILADVPHLIRLAGAYEIAATTLRIPHPYHEQDAVDFVASAQAEAETGACTRFAITLREHQVFCGGIGLRVEAEHRHAELGYWIGVEFWGKGYATEAAGAVLDYGFRELSLHRIYASCYSGNQSSGRVLQKIGMRYEGCQKGHIFKWDFFHDLDLYGILRPDWSAARQP